MTNKFDFNTSIINSLDNTFFEKIDTSIFGHPPSAGVYAVCVSHYPYNLRGSFKNRERIVYIGSSNNLKRRLSTTIHPYTITFERIENALVYIKYFTVENYIAVEKKLINIYKPILNKNNKKEVCHR